MHVVVVGCGRVGSELAVALEGAGESVTVVDKNVHSFTRLPESFAGERVVGFGFDRDTLVEAGVDRAGAVAAVTSGDNSNILTARVARETFGIEAVVARIYDPRRAAIYERLGIPTVATVAWTTEQVLRRLSPQQHHRDWIDPTGTVTLVERALPVTWCARRLQEINEPGRWWLVAVTRTGETKIASSELVGQEGDVLRIVSDVGALDDLGARLGVTDGGH
ncbi:MAG TPA: NAD-binding protein [Acidimicrobiia bacterium]|nr:NAD-binding protein [Acidimicrobiia bacterium]